MDKTLQPRYAIKTETCKYSSILRGYNELYICQIDFFLETTNPDKIEIKDEIFLNVITWVAADDIEYNEICSPQTSDSNTSGYYIVRWKGNAYTPQ